MRTDRLPYMSFGHPWGNSANELIRQWFLRASVVHHHNNTAHSNWGEYHFEVWRSFLLFQRRHLTLTLKRYNVFPLSCLLRKRGRYGTGCFDSFLLSLSVLPHCNYYLKHTFKQYCSNEENICLLEARTIFTVLGLQRPFRLLLKLPGYFS